MLFIEAIVIQNQLSFRRIFIKISHYILVIHMNARLNDHLN